MPKNVILKLKSWLTFPFIRHTKYDRKMVEMLLILTVGVKNVQPEHINDYVTDFIRSES